MATHLWRDLEAAFDSTIDDAAYEFSDSAAAMLLAVQQWLYEQDFEEAADALEIEIVHAENNQ
jgi:hypothetical protein